MLSLRKTNDKKMDWTTIVSALLGALFGGGGVWLINLYTAPEKKKQGQIANLITIIESQDATIKNLIARQDAYEDRVNKRISETMTRALENENRLTRMENAVHRARLCKFNTTENPCPVLVYVDDKQEQENYCSNCQHNNNGR